MRQNVISLRPFIGAKDFSLSRSFYSALGFQESILSNNMSYFSKQGMGFYLQDAFVKDWVDNTMLFLEVDNVEQYWNEVLALDLPGKYEGARLVPMRHEA